MFGLKLQTLSLRALSTLPIGKTRCGDPIAIPNYIGW